MAEDFGTGDELLPDDVPGTPAGKPTHERSWRDWIKEFAAGVAQGEIDPEEGIAQLVGHATGMKWRPEWSENLRRKAESSGFGVAGRIAGNVVNPINLIPGAWLTGAGTPALATRAFVGGANALVRAPGGRAAASWLLNHPGVVRTGEHAIEGGLGGALAPTENEKDMSMGQLLRERGWQAAMGALGGTTLPALAREAAHFGTGVLHTHFPFGLSHAIGAPLQRVGRRLSKASPGKIGRVAGELYGSGAEAEGGAIPDTDPAVDPAADPAVTDPVPAAPRTLTTDELRDYARRRYGP
jgi:hypothetical protein